MNLPVSIYDRTTVKRDHLFGERAWVIWCCCQFLPVASAPDHPTAMPIAHTHARSCPAAMAVWRDPTHGRIDRDIQEQVDEWNPGSLGQRVAIENTLQERRNRQNGGRR